MRNAGDNLTVSVLQRLTPIYGLGNINPYGNEISQGSYAPSPFIHGSVGSHAAGEGCGLALHSHQILLDQQFRSLQALPHICYLLTYHVIFIKIDPYNQKYTFLWK